MEKMVSYGLSQYNLEKCLSGNCAGCDREHHASCGDLIDELKEQEAKIKKLKIPLTNK